MTGTVAGKKKKRGLTRKGLNGGSTLRARRSSQFMCRKNGWALEIQQQQFCHISICQYTAHTHFYDSAPQMFLPGPQLHLLVQPRVAVRHFVSAAERKKNNCRLFFSTTSNFNKAVTTRKAHERKKIGFHSSPFSGGPWLLV